MHTLQIFAIIHIARGVGGKIEVKIVILKVLSYSGTPGQGQVTNRDGFVFHGVPWCSMYSHKLSNGSSFPMVFIPGGGD